MAAERVSIFTQSVRFLPKRGMRSAMSGMGENGVAGHFARQMKKERLAHGWSLAELGRRTGLDPAHLGRVESGRRPPTQAIAAGLDIAFPERHGWFTDWLSESREWKEIPATFRNWPDYEDRAATIRTWNPGIIGGLLQTEDYARALFPDDAATVAHRMKRQEILARDAPPMFHVVLDEAVLYQGRGGKEVIRAQLERLIASVGPHLTLQVVPSDVNPRSAGAFTIATVDGDDVAYIETAVRGIVTSSREELAALTASWEAIRTFALSQRDSLDLIKKVIEEKWT